VLRNVVKEAAHKAVIQEHILPPQINWRQVLDDLRAHGCSGYRVAQEIGVGWSTVQAWKGIKEDIGYGYGRALIRLHSKYCGSAMTVRRLTEGEQNRHKTMREGR
jgi:hypothetical protein